MTTSTATCSTSTASTASGLARRAGRQRGSGVVPSRLRTPYRRSKPGGDRLRGERRRQHREGEHPGSEDVDPGAGADVHDVDLHEDDQQHRRDDHGEQQLLAVAQQLRGSKPGLGADHPGQRRRSGAGVRGRGSRSSQLPPGQLEEDVLEGAPLDREAVGQHVVGGAPGRDGRQQLGADRAAGRPDDVRPGRLLDRGRAGRQRGCQLGQPQPRLGAEPDRPGARRSRVSSAGEPAATTRPASTITTWSASCSASSMRWVVSTTATPSARRPADAGPTWRAGPAGPGPRSARRGRPARVVRPRRARA